MLPGISLFDMTGQTAIVTGGSKGLGKAIAEGLASAGANIALISRNQSEAESAAKEIADTYQTQTLGLEVDVTQQPDIEAMVATVFEKFGRIDALVNNAGINIRGPISELTLEQFRECRRDLDCHSCCSSHHEETGLWSCDQPCQHSRSCRLGKSDPLRNQQRRSGSIDTSHGTRVRRNRHHGKRHLPRPLPDPHERTDCRH